jgi:hypothetical protein
MTIIIAAVLFSVALGVLALRANTRLRRENRLPMQWWINGDGTVRLIRIWFVETATGRNPDPDPEPQREHTQIFR